MQTNFFKWAKAQGLSDAEIGKRLGYSERHVRRFRCEGYPINRNFRDRVIASFGQEHPEVRYLFFENVTKKSTERIRGA